MVAASFLLTTIFVLLTPRHPYGGLGYWCTDHFSHYGSAILFLHKGFAVYRKPVRELTLRPQGDPVDEFLSETQGRDYEVCQIGERQDRSRPLLINRQEFPRPYPPGVFLFTALEALLYDKTEISFLTINKLFLLKTLVAAHLLVLVVIQMLRAANSRQVPDGP